MKPVARREGLLIRELPDEVLVYDRKEHRAHCLNHTAATVFRHADGTRTVADLARLLAPGEAGPMPEDVVTLALARLGEAGLLEGGPLRPALSRREVVRRVAIGAAVLLPAVASIVAPTPAEAAASCASSCPGQANGTPCDCFGVTPCPPGQICISGACSVGGC